MVFGVVFVVGVFLGVVSDVLGGEGPFRRRPSRGVVVRVVVRVGSGSGCFSFIAHVSSFRDSFFGNRSIVTHFGVFGISEGSQGN